MFGHVDLSVSDFADMGGSSYYTNQMVDYNGLLDGWVTNSSEILAGLS